jgi:hypothetical protein
MQTITFYSYKGGTGRSLVLANAAKYLTRLGQRVFCLDLDLEAPGLHRKLWLDRKETMPPLACGVVDWFYHYETTNKVDNDLGRYSLSVPRDQDGTGNIMLMPAGNILAQDYWRKLSGIDWHSLFYSEKPSGIPLFLELKALIEKHFAPDFLLIDARTGITEVGGIATTLLPDQVVCLLLNNSENLEGSREVLRGIRSAKRLPNQKPIELMTVLSRIPSARNIRGVDEATLVDEVKAYLNEKDRNGESLGVSEILVLHSEDSLQVREMIRVGGSRTVDESLLLRDYLRLFSRVIPYESVVPHLDNLVRTAYGRMIDSPDQAQLDLETLATSCPHPASLFPLLKYYRLRNAPPEKMLETAARYWELSDDSRSDVIWETVKDHFRFEKKEGLTRQRPYSAEFIESAWKTAGGNHIDVGIALARFYLAQYRARKAFDILDYMLAQTGGQEQGVTAAIDTLVAAEQWDAAGSFVTRYRPTLSAKPGFQAAWANLAISQGDVGAAKTILGIKEFSPAQLQATQPITYARLLRLAGHNEELNAVLVTLLDPALASRETTPKLYEIHQLFVELGKRNLFEARVKEILPNAHGKRILQTMGFSTTNFL